MNEIEKLYKLVGIPKCGKRQCKDSKYLECQNYCFCNMDNKCDKFIFEYPPFTAEKQLELVKWLAINKGISINYDDRYFEWGMATDFYGGHFFDNFDECLADLVNAIWQDLTDEEKQQIKEILE